MWPFSLREKAGCLALLEDLELLEHPLTSPGF